MHLHPVPRPMPVMLLVTDLDVAGAEKCCFELARRLDRHLFRPEVGCLIGRGEIGGWLADLGVPVHYFDLPSAVRAGVAGRPTGVGPVRYGAAVLRAIARLSHLLSRGRFVVCQTFLFHANFIGRLAASMARVPVIVSNVRVEEARHYHILLDAWTAGLIDQEICVSRTVQAYTQLHTGLKRSKLPVIPNGIDLSRFTRLAAPLGQGTAKEIVRRSALRRRLGLPETAPLLLFVGRFRREKALDVLLAAFAKVVRDVPDVHLMLAGSGALEPRLRARVEALGVGQRVIFAGWQKDPRDAYLAADCFVLSSDYEGMPNVVLEAMASGLPVVSTDAAGCAEIIEHGETGLIAPRQWPEPLAFQIGLLLNNPAQALEMGRAGRRRIEQRFSLDRVVHLYEQRYLDILARKHVLEGWAD